MNPLLSEFVEKFDITEIVETWLIVSSDSRNQGSELDAYESSGVQESLLSTRTAILSGTGTFHHFLS